MAEARGLTAGEDNDEINYRTTDCHASIYCTTFTTGQMVIIARKTFYQQLTFL